MSCCSIPRSTRWVVLPGLVVLPVHAVPGSSTNQREGKPSRRSAPCHLSDGPCRRLPRPLRPAAWHARQPAAAPCCLPRAPLCCRPPLPASPRSASTTRCPRSRTTRASPSAWVRAASFLNCSNVCTPRRLEVTCSALHAAVSEASTGLKAPWLSASPWSAGTPISAYGQESHNRAARQRIPHRREGRGWKQPGATHGSRRCKRPTFAAAPAPL